MEPVAVGMGASIFGSGVPVTLANASGEIETHFTTAGFTKACGAEEPQPARTNVVAAIPTTAVANRFRSKGLRILQVLRHLESLNWPNFLRFVILVGTFGSTPNYSRLRFYS